MLLHASGTWGVAWQASRELGNHEGRLGWGEGSFYEKGTRGRQAHTRHQ